MTFVDKASITVRDPYVQGWFMFDYSVPQTAPNGSHYLSAKMLWSFDCGLRQLFPRQAVYYASNRGAGTSVHSFAPPFEETKEHMQDVVPETYGEHMIDYACQNAPKPKAAP